MSDTPFFHINDRAGDGDKLIQFDGPSPSGRDTLQFYADYDDVWRPDVDAVLAWMMVVLNQAWAANPVVKLNWQDETCECGKMSNRLCGVTQYLNCGT